MLMLWLNLCFGSSLDSSSFIKRKGKSEYVSDEQSINFDDYFIFLCFLSSNQFQFMAIQEVIGFYKENKKIIVETFNSLGFKVYGGKNAPYLWVHFPGRNSWDVFSEILEKTHIVTTPGSGFGLDGEGFIRVSAFGHRENVLEDCIRFKQLYN
ncbi:hypothetical protein CRYUN_Cryun10bG0159400 [Craigia yunnanensis]